VAPTTLRELTILRSLDHANVIKLRETFVTPEKFTLVFDYMPYDLRKLFKLRKGRPLERNLCRSYAYQVLCAIYYLHVHRVIHRDIKPENLLIDAEGHLKLCDFGLSRIFTIPVRNYTEGVVTLWYRPPEIFLHNDFYELGIDIWSAGCVIAEMCRGVPLFVADSDLDLAHKVFRVLGTPSQNVLSEFADIQAGKITFPAYPRGDFAQMLESDDPYLIDLIQKMLAVDPKRRITAKEALHHPYFDGVSQVIRDLCYPEE
jgi:serine/threonine protein kinase